ncbi:MAG: ketol-acid reductoisomerase [Planctomycetes bacterium]|nr:ketol-acid reductoisomerase [Planctomycetota bacterium]
MGRPECQVLQDSAGLWLEALHGQTVAIVGFGNQGRAHALNLRDSGIRVVVGGRSGSTARAAARSERFEEFDTAEAASLAALVALCVPDHVAGDVWATVEPAMRADAVAGFVCGAPLRYGLVAAAPARGIVMVAPKGPGSTLRKRFTMGQGIPALMAVHAAGADPKRTRALALAWAAGIGCGRSGVIESTSAVEAETDLFGEQAVLCGGMVHLMQAAYDALVAAGYPPEIAYIECIHELKQVADLVYEHGIAGMRERVSPTAAFGIDEAGPVVVDDRTREAMKDLLERVRDGRFFAALMADQLNGGRRLREGQTQAAAMTLEQAGRTVRAMMPWLAQESRP